MSNPGRWPVVLSGRAIRELRQLSEDKRTLEIVQTKLKELSSGQFTADNHLPVRGSHEYIPIYRARLSNDLRIIYLIDLISDGKNEFDRQSIKVFSVSSRARVAYDFWVKVSKFLAQKGSEYRDHCVQRDTLNTPNGPINTPASFDHKEYVLPVVDPESATDAEANMNELHETVVLEKFTPMTKSLYNSILADMEAVLPMALNPDEKAIVRHHGTSVVIGRSGTGKTTALIYKMRANAQLEARSEGIRSMRQLFVTRSKVLTQHIAANYRGLVESSEIANKSAEELDEIRKANKTYQNRELVEFDNSVDFRDDLPRRFSQLTEANFPLFLSFDKLCDLIEADYLPDEESSMSTKLHKRHLISFSDFKRRYWPTFDHKLTRYLDPALVYSEILGVIKGHGRSLTRNEYLSDLSHKKSPLLADVRHQVYAVFEVYVKQCRLNGEIDGADRTRTILENYKVPSESKVDYVFVDEVQDHLMADIHRKSSLTNSEGSLCSNLDGGYWCGDTAQTINIGSSFRIKDLKAYIYDQMLPSDTTITRQRKAAAPFATFELTVNYRSHGGIVRYAASLVELIYTLFPNSIDHMQPESATTPGTTPLLFVSPVDDEALFVHYLLDKKPVEQAAPFGAQQAIIVRSESTANSLTNRLKKCCTVLSLLETKGLEFDDLILYNFFAESEAPSSAWRVVLGLSFHRDNGRIQYDKPDLSVAISPVLCSELKQLYVAVTRARHRCWLWDSGATIDLMKVFWERPNLIAQSEALTNLSKFAASSKDLRQWAYRGQEFFSNGLYALALSCFERAGQAKEAAIADAYQHMTEAKSLQGNSTVIKAALVKAAGKMKVCAEASEREGSSHASATLWYHAASCYVSAQEVVKASSSYCRGRFYDQAALIAFDAQEMDECLRVLATHNESMDTSVVKKITDVYSIFYLRERDYSRLRKLFGGSLKKCIDLARSLKFAEQMKELLQMNRQFKELADVHLEDGSPVEAVRCLLQNLHGDTYSTERSRNIISSHLWSNFGLAATPSPKSIEQAKVLIDICTKLGGFADQSARHDIELFRALINRKSLGLDLYQPGGTFGDLDHTNEEEEARIILLLDHVLKTTEWISSRSYPLFSSYLQGWKELVTSITRLVTLRKPSQHATARRLLGLSEAVASGSIFAPSVHIPDGSLLQSASPTNRTSGRGGKKSSGHGVNVTATVADQRIRASLTEYLKQQLVDLQPGLFKSPWTATSPPSQRKTGAVFPNLDSQQTVAQGPLSEGPIESLPSVYAILSPIKNTNPNEAIKNSVNSVQFLWITRLFNLVFSNTGVIKNLAFDLTTLDGSNIVRTWIKESLQLLDPTKHQDGYVTLLVICLSLMSELYPDVTPTKELSPSPPSSGASLSTRCPKDPEIFTKDVCKLFQRDYPEEAHEIVWTMEAILEENLAVDVAVLVHFVERMVCDAVRSTRIGTSWFTETPSHGFSGLVAPISWAASLVMHAKPARSPMPALWLGRLLDCIDEILRRLLNGFPAYWKAINDEPWNHNLGSLVARLLWSVCFVVVNLHPEHPSVSAALNVIQASARAETRFRSTLVSTMRNMHVDWKTFSTIDNQRSCLLAFSQTLQHEELVLLSDSHELICPAKQWFVHKTIAFTNLSNLRAILLGIPEQPDPPTLDQPGLTVANPDSATIFTQKPARNTTTFTQEQQVAESPIIPSSPVQPLVPSVLEAIKNPSAESAQVEPETRARSPLPTITLEEAALRVQAARRRRVKKLQLEPSDFDEEGQLYMQYSQNFIKGGKKTMEIARERIAFRLVRGPCLYIILGLRMLVEDMNDYVDGLDEELRAPGLDSRALAELQKSIQQRKDKIKKHRGKVDSCLSSKSCPPLLKVKNLAGVRTQAAAAWDAFMLVKNSETLPVDEDEFKEVEEMISRGRDIVLGALKKFAKTA